MQRYFKRTSWSMTCLASPFTSSLVIIKELDIYISSFLSLLLSIPQNIYFRLNAFGMGMIFSNILHKYYVGFLHHCQTILIIFLLDIEKSHIAESAPIQKMILSHCFAKCLQRFIVENPSFFNIFHGCIAVCNSVCNFGLI